MSDKEPLLTRSKLRELKKQEEKKARIPAKTPERTHQLKEIEREYDTPQSSNFFGRKKREKQITRSRASETEKTQERSRTLNIAIIVVTCLLIVLFYIVFNW